MAAYSPKPTASRFQPQEARFKPKTLLPIRFDGLRSALPLDMTNFHWT